MLVYQGLDFLLKSMLRDRRPIGHIAMTEKCVFLVSVCLHRHVSSRHTQRVQTGTLARHKHKADFQNLRDFGNLRFVYPYPQAHAGECFSLPEFACLYPSECARYFPGREGQRGRAISRPSRPICLTHLAMHVKLCSCKSIKLERLCVFCLFRPLYP